MSAGWDSFPKKNCLKFTGRLTCLCFAHAMLPKSAPLRDSAWFFWKRKPAEFLS